MSEDILLLRNQFTNVHQKCARGQRIGKNRAWKFGRGGMIWEILAFCVVWGRDLRHDGMGPRISYADFGADAVNGGGKGWSGLLE